MLPLLVDVEVNVGQHVVDVKVKRVVLVELQVDDTSDTSGVAALVALDLEVEDDVLVLEDALVDAIMPQQIAL
eukprot:4175841-Amphidinium_carterae.1